MKFALLVALLRISSLAGFGQESSELSFPPNGGNQSALMAKSAMILSLQLRKVLS
jgi:hypothetical protein